MPWEAELHRHILDGQDGRDVPGGVGIGDGHQR